MAEDILPVRLDLDALERAFSPENARGELDGNRMYVIRRLVGELRVMTARAEEADRALRKQVRLFGEEAYTLRKRSWGRLDALRKIAMLGGKAAELARAAIDEDPSP